MSSLIRRLSIRMMKRAGYTREKFIGITDPVTGERRLRDVLRDGEITDPDDNPIGRDWPRRLAASARAPVNPKAKDLIARQRRDRGQHDDRPPRALRRSKKSRAWLVRRAADRQTRA